MHTTTTGTAAKAAAAALLALALAGCGSDTADPADGDATGSADGGFDVSEATLTDDPFCDQIDTAMVGGVLGLPTDKVRTQVDREVGEEFEGPDEEAPPPESVANLCVFGSSTSQFLVSVQPDATSADVQESIDDLASLAGKGSSETCETSEASSFGDPAAAFTCTSGSPLERVRVVVTGLVGDSKFYCSATKNQGAGPDFQDATLDACSSALEQLATPA
jgi:hypothetical protein